jgi:hypothetical protein
MKCSNKLADCGSLILILISTALPVSADEANPSPGYIYKDDWAVVSAPPPPGPYRAVNIDPRVPGVGAIPPLSMDAACTGCGRHTALVNGCTGDG